MKNNKKKIIGILIAVLTAAILLLECYLSYQATGEVDVGKIEEAVDTIVTEINKSTVEIPGLTEEDEIALEEQIVEDEAFELQGEIAYEGDRASTWNVELGDYAGLTYYSQIDSRWRDNQFSSIDDSSQTIGSSGCGPTVAAMIVSSIKGNITPDIMSELFVNNGYRSANNGTYWSAFRAVADEFDIRYQEKYKLNDALELLNNNNYIVVSVGNGLFTTGGHYIVIYGIEGNNLKIYDPYLYAGKFETSTRRGKVSVEGNTIYCSIENFREYANYKCFFCYGYNPEIVKKENKTDSQVITAPIVIPNTVGQTKRLSRATTLYENSNLSGTRYNYKANTTVTVLENITNTIDKVKIRMTGRVAYIDNSVYNNVTIKKSSTVGQGKKLKRCTLYKNSNLSGAKYNYKNNTTVVVLENINSYIDKVKVRLTGRIAYINVNSYQ